jgi:hypothetical protein
MATRMTTVLDPTAKSTRKEFKMAVRPDHLEGKTVGLIWNTKPGGDILLNRFAEQLNQRFHFGQILKHTKASSALGIAEDSLNEFSTKCDFVIVATAD